LPLFVRQDSEKFAAYRAASVKSTVQDFSPHYVRFLMVRTPRPVAILPPLRRCPRVACLHIPEAQAAVHAGYCGISPAVTESASHIALLSFTSAGRRLAGKSTVASPYLSRDIRNVRPLSPPNGQRLACNHLKVRGLAEAGKRAL